MSRTTNAVAASTIGIEAGMGTHYIAGELISLGHDVRQVPPAYAKTFNQTHKVGIDFGKELIPHRCPQRDRGAILWNFMPPPI